MTRRVTIAMMASADNDMLQTRIGIQQYARMQQLAAVGRACSCVEDTTLYLSYSPFGKASWSSSDQINYLSMRRRWNTEKLS